MRHSSRYVRRRLCSVRSPSDEHQFSLDPAGDFGFAVADHHVDFAAHAEVWQIDAGLDREAGVGQDQAVVLGLEIVEVGAVTVNLRRNGVPGAMKNLRAISL